VRDEVYFPPMPINLNNLKDRIRRAAAKLDQPLLKNIEECRATNGAHIELA
jgi:hypothetical protein